MTTAVSVLEQRLSQEINDWLEVIVTTAIAANNSIISTNLTSYDGGRDDYFNDWWVYITDKANITVLRQISDYATATGTLTVRGTALTAEALGTDYATIRLHRYDRNFYINAFNDAARELKTSLWQNLDIKELVTGNILPNSHFRDWAVSTAPDKYAMQDSNITATAYTTAGGYWGGAKSMNALTGAGGAGKYVYITSDSYPPLLDLMGQGVSAYVWAYPQVANDASIEVYTLQADGTAQTLTSTTTCPAAKWTLLELESQSLNDDLVKVEVRFKVATASKYVYYDHARVMGVNQTRYLLPTDLVNNFLDKVSIQSSSYAEHPCDDLMPQDWETIHGCEITNDGTNQWLELPTSYEEGYLLRLEGRKPLSTVSAYTSTIEVDGSYIDLFIAYSKYKLYQMIEGPVAAEDIGRYETQSAKAYGEYLRLRSVLGMTKPSSPINMWTYSR